MVGVQSSGRPEGRSPGLLELFYVTGIPRDFLLHKKALTCQRCALARRCRLSQATARGARMCQGTFFFLKQRACDASPLDIF